MPNRAEPINLIDFTGGLNLRKNQFQLNSNESPEMRNVAIDPVGGIYTRRGWDRWSQNIVPEGGPWDPHRAFLIQFSDGTDMIYIAANNKVFYSHPDGAFFDLGITVEANPHLADFVGFGDDVYISGGHQHQMVRRRLELPPVLLTEAGAGSWNDDYLNPVLNVGPRCEMTEAHSGYLFAANTSEDGVRFPNRLRWSHPTSPEDWAQADFIDILTGGSKITALMSYEDHLLIFKNDSIWALYGYDAESWQLVQKSSTIGAVSPQGVGRNEQFVFFYSASDRGGIYAYNGERPLEISEQIRIALESLHRPDLVWVGWIGRKLWVTVPWDYDGATDESIGVLIFDPSIGGGAWTYYASTTGAPGPLVAGSNVDSEIRPMAVLRSPEVPCVVRVMANSEAAVDTIWDWSVLGYNTAAARSSETGGYIVTDTDAEIIMMGAPGDEPFATVYRTPWITNDWPTRKKSFRRPNFICRITGFDHDLRVRSYRDYEELNARRQHTLTVPAGRITAVPPEVPGQVAAVWNAFNWNDGTRWNETGAPPVITSPAKQGASLRRGSSYGLCKALQLRVEGATPGARWGVDAIVLKVVMRRFR